MITYNNLIDDLRSFQESHLQINSFGFGDINRVEKSQITFYPCLWVHPTVSQITKNLIECNFNVLVMDKLSESNNNEQDIISDTLQIISDLRVYLNDGSFSEVYVDTEDNPISLSMTPFSERFGDLVAGWNLALRISLENDESLCVIPGIGGGGNSVFASNSVGLSLRSMLSNYLPITGGTLTGCLYTPCISGGTIYSGSSELSTIINNIASQYSGGGANSSYIYSASNQNILITTGGTNPQQVNVGLNTSVTGLDELSANSIETTSIITDQFTAGDIFANYVEISDINSTTGTIQTLSVFSTSIGGVDTLDNIYYPKNSIRASAATPSMFTGTPQKAIITFSTPFINTGYSISVVSSTPDARNFSVEAIATSGFTINTNHSSVPTQNIYWTATKYI